MKCINCNKEMEKGFISSPSHVVWSKQSYKFRVPMLEDENVIKILPLSMFKIKQNEAYICKECKTVIVKY